LSEHCIYLENSFVSLYGYKIYGTPYNTKKDYAFYRDRNKLKEIWEQIPSDIDILISH
jgi:hypothetical protein